jgi:hypothetical protein
VPSPKRENKNQIKSIFYRSHCRIPWQLVSSIASKSNVRRTAIQRDTRATRRRRSLRLRPPLSFGIGNQPVVTCQLGTARATRTRYDPSQAPPTYRHPQCGCGLARHRPPYPSLSTRCAHRVTPETDVPLTVSLASPARSLSPPRNHGRFPFPLRYPLIFLWSPRRQQGWCWCVCSAFADSPPGLAAVRRRRRPNCVGTWTTYRHR